jgi:hypothetical protein
LWQERTVSEMAVEVLTHKAKALVYRTGQPFEQALVAILKTDCGRQLTELADGPHRHDQALDWHANLVRKGAQKEYYAWLEDYKRWLEDEEARAEHQAFLKQTLGHVRTSRVGATRPDSGEGRDSNPRRRLSA